MEKKEQVLRGFKMVRGDITPGEDQYRAWYMIQPWLRVISSGIAMETQFYVEAFNAYVLKGQSGSDNRCNEVIAHQIENIFYTARETHDYLYQNDVFYRSVVNNHGKPFIPAKSGGSYDT